MKSYLLIKKVSFLLLLYGLTVFRPSYLCAAQKSVSEIIQGTFSGDYTIYRDYSWKKPTWIGFLYYDDETYGAFLYTPETHSRISILFSVKPEKGTLVLTGQKIISPPTPQDSFAVNYLMNILPKLYELRFFPQQQPKLFGTAEKTVQIDEFGGNTSLHFNSYIPLFHLKTIKNTTQGIVLELTEIGSIRESGDKAFYSYTPVEPVEAVNRFKRNMAAKKETLTVNGTALHLDSQWKKIADNSFLCGDAAFLTVTSVRLPPDSGAGLTAQEQLIRLLISSSQYVKVLMPYTIIAGTEALFTLTQSIYDVELKKITKDIKRCVKNTDGSFTVTSLTVDIHAYNAEKSYFDRLF